MNNKESIFKSQVIPLVLTVLVFGVLVLLLYSEIRVLNLFTENDIAVRIRWVDVLIGLTIYLKTAIDFAIYIGRLMGSYGGWKSRVSIEIGTALGNALGTMIILAVWTFFKEIDWLLALMVFLASLVLFKLAEDSLEHAVFPDGRMNFYNRLIKYFVKILSKFNALVAPVLKYVIPSLKVEDKGRSGFWSLFVLSFSVPFILGLDDFAGYVPLFSIVNVFGFGIGVLLGHMILNISLYLKPEFTIKAVKNYVISFIGSLAFVGLGIWGLIEVAKIIGH